MSWLHFLSYAVVTAVTPGPNNIMSMSNAGRLGFRRSFPFNLGIWAGFSLVMLLCTLFCGTLSSLIPKIKMPMLFIGAAYMLWLAWKTFRSPPLEGSNCDLVLLSRLEQPSDLPVYQNHPKHLEVAAVIKANFCDRRCCAVQV